MRWILLLGYSVLVVGCAYATGNAIIHVLIDRKLEVDTTLNNEEPIKAKEYYNDYWSF